MSIAPRNEHTTPWEVLTVLLVHAIGQRGANGLLETALTNAQLTATPSSAADVLAFARHHLLASLAANGLGMQWAVGLLDQLGAELVELGYREVPCPLEDPGPPQSHRHSGVQVRGHVSHAAPSLDSPPKPIADAQVDLPATRTRIRRSEAPEEVKNCPLVAGDERRPRVLLVLEDALERASLARALLREGFDVRSTESSRDLEQSLGNEPARLAVVDMRHRDAKLLLAKLAAIRPTPALVVCADDPQRGGAIARAAGLEVFHVYTTHTPRREVVERIRECTAAEGEHRLRPSAGAHDASALRRVPCHVMAPADLGWFAMELEPAAASFLASVDGRADLETLAKRCGLGFSDAIRIAEELAEGGTILFE
jgi:hypothetical protein